MQRDRRAFLWDVRDAALAIGSFLSGMDHQAYIHNDMVQAAVERKFEVIGEALGQLSKMDEALGDRIPNLPQIVAFRNQLIHGYAAVNPSTVWNIARDSLPELLTTIEALLTELG